MLTDVSLTRDLRQDDVIYADAMLCGIDLSGFSRWLDTELDRRGRDGLEAISDEISHFLEEAVAAIANEGFMLGAFLGDGLIGLRGDAAAVGALKRIQAAMRSIEPSARVVTARGAAEAITLPGWNGRTEVMLTGPGVVACHRKLEDYNRVKSMNRRVAGAGIVKAKLLDAEIADAVILFVCLQGRPPPAAALMLLRERLPVWQAAADALGGRFERITHDDNGYLLRFSWLGGSGSEAAATQVSQLIGADCDNVVAIGCGLARGTIFRAAVPPPAPLYDSDRTIIQGGAVNRAAKMAKHGAGPILTQRLTSVSGRDVSNRAAGRETELAWLQAQIADARVPLIRITGAAGLGKSHLLRALSASIIGAKAIVVTATPQRCRDQLWLWNELIAALDPDVVDGYAAVLASIASARGQVSAAVLIEQQNRGILDALATAVVLRPGLVVVIDDVQWADAASRRMIVRAALAVQGLRLVIAARDGYDGLVPQIAGCVTLELQSLPPAALARAAASAGAPAPNTLLALANGNPLHAIQLAFAAREHAGGFDHASIGAVIDTRVSALAPRTRAILRMLAIADRPITQARLSMLADRSGIDPASIDLQSLADRAFVTVHDNEVALSHRSLSERISMLTPPSVRAQLHSQMAYILVAARKCGDTAPGRGEIAAHWAAAAKIDRAAIAYVRDGDSALADGDFESAQALFANAETALRKRGGNASRLAHTQAGCGMAAWGQGDLRRAVSLSKSAHEFIDHALTGGRSRRVGSLRRLGILAGFGSVPTRLKLAIFRAGSLRAESGFFTGSAYDFAMGGFTSFRLNDSNASRDAIRSRGIGALATIVGLMHQRRASLWLLGKCRAIGPDGLPASSAAGGEAIWRLAAGEWEQGAALLDEAQQLLGNPADPHLLGGVACMRALHQHLRGDSEASLASFGQVAKLADRIGNRQYQAWALYGSAMPLLANGRTTEAEAAVIAAECLLADNDDKLSNLNCAGLRARIAVSQGDLGLALEYAAAGLALCRQVFPGNFGSVEGFSAPAIVTASIARYSQAPQVIRRRAAQLRRPALSQLRRYVNICKIGAPRLSIAVALATPDTARAMHHASSAAGLATTLQMPFDVRATEDLMNLISRGNNDATLYQPGW